MTELIYSFNTKKSPLLTEVGGKAMSLISTTKAGMPVPGGLALTVAFFQPWTDSIKGTNQWKSLLQNPVRENCDAVKAIAEKLVLTTDQKSQLNKAMTEMDGTDVFAVRSSSPEEDLSGTSFAGMYETYLGTTRSQLEDTIAKAYSSMFDYRVMEYKAQNSLKLEGTCISVIIQKQVASDVSGVGFSLNPMNNCYDEVMINASFGLGEAIVSGIVTPDTYVYDASEKKILEKKVNKKEQALTDEQIVELSALIKKCEEHYGKPIDTEWAYETGQLYLLQARPVTTHIPFYSELMTKPGEPKNIYLDMMGLTQGFTDTMSILGMEIFAAILETIKGEIMITSLDGTTPALYGRMYFNVSNFYKGSGRKMTEAFLKGYDGNVKRIFENIDYKEYTQGPVPSVVKGLKGGMFKMSMKMMPAVIKATTSDYKIVINNYLAATEKIMKEADAMTVDGDIFNTISKTISGTAAIMNDIGAMMLGMLAGRKFRKMFKGSDIEADIISLCMDLDGNVTSEMGYLMFRMASYAEFKQTSTREDFMSKINNSSYSSDFMTDYNDFMKRFGARGFMEIDVASPRVWEDPASVFDRLKEINTEDSQISNVKEKRQAAYDRLLALAREKKIEKKFRKTAEYLQGTFGYREHPKYVIVYVLGKLHNVLLEVGDRFVKNGQLDNNYQIFDLNLKDISAALNDNKFDVQKRRAANLEPIRKCSHVKDWPMVIDSRGKIFKPQILAEEGDLAGDPIAPGKITGRAKVLRSPYEKSLEPGEILVTKATEPSWTPIFINAAGVVMEIGGALQHGGIIAREYGIPCVSGLMGAMEIINDGDLLEVDGTNGVVKILEPV